MIEGQGGRRPVRFEILGPLRAWRDDDELDLGPAKQRAVLAVLLANANRAVPTFQIVDAVWRDSPPENGTNVVQKYVAGLRRVLDPDRSPRTPGPQLALTPGGYRLTVGPGRLDAHVFQERVQEARGARDDHRLADAARHITEALALWRGDALAGLSGPAFDTVRDRLTESRAAALEEWAEIELELGHHARLAPELVRLVAEFPLREQLRYLLILTLYRCGRQAEAHVAYREARRFLVEEFGVEPGGRLQQLHRRMLEADPALTEPADRAVPRAQVAVKTAEPLTPSAAGAAAQGHLASHTPPAPAPAAPSLLDNRAPGSAAGEAASPHSARTVGPATEDERSLRAPAAALSRRPRWQMWSVRLLAVLIPLASFGMLTWVVIAYEAGRRRSMSLAAGAAGYLALVLVFAVAMFLNPSLETIRPSDVVAMVVLLLLWFGGTAHVALLNFDRSYRPV